MTNKMYIATLKMYYYLIILLTLISIILGVPHNGRIVGGKMASPGQFPFAVSIADPEHTCGGAIINKNWVLTAGHCLLVLRNDSTILVGTNLLHSGGVRYNITQMIQHEGFNLFTAKDDIALFRINGEFEFSELVQPVEYIEPEDNSTCVLAGWGAIGEDDADSEELLFVELTTLDFEGCREAAGDQIGDLYLGPTQVCTLGPEGKGPCYDDSGAPLVCDGKLAGIMSYAVMPCALGYPDVYTKPTNYVDWINEKIQS